MTEINNSDEQAIETILEAYKYILRSLTGYHNRRGVPYLAISDRSGVAATLTTSFIDFLNTAVTMRSKTADDRALEREQREQRLLDLLNESPEAE